MAARGGRNFVFNTVPTIHRRRSVFDLSHRHLTSMNVGYWYPVYLREIYPGDSDKCEARFLARATSGFIKPVMDNLFMDIQFYFVPNRQILQVWDQVMGDPGSNPWAPTKETTVPKTYFAGGSSASYKGTLADYFGLAYNTSSRPEGSSNARYSVLPFRAYAKIWNDWLRDQNVDQPVNLNTGSMLGPYEPIRGNTTAWGVNNYTGMPAPCSKVHDYFTSALPAPQRGTAVNLFNGQEFNVDVTSAASPFPSGGNLLFYPRNPGQLTNDVNALYMDSNNDHSVKVFNTSTQPTGGSTPISGSNLAVVPSDDPLTVNDLRLAFQTQKLLERSARSGARYVEYIRAAFGVDPGDYRLQRPEYLGGSRNPLSIQAVAQTSAPTDTSSLGDLGAYSVSAGRAKYMKGFVEHGWVLGLACLRYYHTYQQGVQKFWTRSKRTDFFDPVFSNIGEQPVMQTELYGSAAADAVFGYQEAWADLRYSPNRVSAALRSVPGELGLSIWHFADLYDNAPVLGAQFIHENPDNVDRTLNAGMEREDQFIVDFYFECKSARCLPTYSVPSLIDHN